MSTDPTQPMNSPAPAGDSRPEQPEPREHDGARPGPAQSPGAAPTRAQPTAQPVAPTRAQPAQPAFKPAQPPRPTFHPAQPAQPPPQAAGQPAGPARRQPPQHDWPEQPPRNSPQPGWPPAGGAPGAGNAGTYEEVPGSGGTRREGSDQDAYPGYPGVPKPRRRRRRRRWVVAFFTLIVVVILLLLGDRVALAVAENDFASQAVANGMPVKPSVTIEGFPFLTQLVARDFGRVDISASNVPAGPVNITSIKATLTGMHLNSSYNGATVDHINATAFVSFSSLSSVGSVGGLTMTADGPGKVKISAGIGPFSDTEYAKVSQTGPQTISVQVLPSGSPLSGLLSSFGSFSFDIPKLPVDVHITNLSITPQGLTVTAAADNANLTKS